MKKNMLKPVIVILFALCLMLNIDVSGGDLVNGDRAYFVQSAAASGKMGYWDIRGLNPKYKKGDKLVVWELGDRNNDRRYRFIPLGDDFYRIEAVYAGGRGVLDNSGGKSVPGNPIIIWDRHTGDNQKFRLKHLGNGNFRIYLRDGKTLQLPRTTRNGVGVMIGYEHLTDPHHTWRLIDCQTGRPLVPAERGFVVNCENGAGAELDVYTYNRESRKYENAKYTLNNSGSIDLGNKYNEESSMLFVVSKEGFISDHQSAYPKKGNRSVKLKLTRPAGNEKLVETSWRGRRAYYEYNGNYYRKDGEITRRYDFFFPSSNVDNQAVRKLKNEIKAGPVAKTDQEILEKIKSVFEFLDKKGKSSMGKDERAKEAGNDLFSGGRKGENYPLDRWPRFDEYARVYDKYGFIPLGNCTANSQAAATLLLAAGVPADKFAVSKFHYSASWSVEHWVLIFYINDKWFYLDPQSAGRVRIDKVENFRSYPKVRGAWDITMPFELYVPPGSNINRVPYVGELK